MNFSLLALRQRPLARARRIAQLPGPRPGTPRGIPCRWNLKARPLFARPLQRQVLRSGSVDSSSHSRPLTGPSL
eukprot:9090464-Alexandrium_andersonii.AAC.1